MGGVTQENSNLDVALSCRRDVKSGGRTAPRRQIKPYHDYHKPPQRSCAARATTADKQMSEPLTFMMGKYAASLPTDLRYARNHMWRRPAEEDRSRFGFTSYAVRLMQDVYFLDWQVNAGDVVAQRQTIGHIETSKAQSDLFAPMAGAIVLFNEEVLKDPSAINVDNYGAGWLFEMAGPEAGTMSVQEYHQFLEANWENTQRILKGQI